MNITQTNYEIASYLSSNFFCGNQEIVKIIQEYNQDFSIEQELKLESNNQPKSLNKTKKTSLSKALQSGQSETAQKIIDSMIEQNTPFTELEFWQIKPLKNLDFRDEEFLALDSRTKRLVFRTANNVINIQFVERLNRLGMHTSEFSIKAPSILSELMDVAAIHRTIFQFLIQLRQENRFLTKEEFADQSSLNSWVEKSNFTRILGSNHISQLGQKLGLKYIKVPEKKAVLASKDMSSITFTLCRYGEGLIYLDSGDLGVCAQKIQQVNRFLSREEITELFTVIDATNFLDLHNHNFIVGADGIYFIDTEFKSFSGTIQWHKMHRLTGYISVEDRDWFAQLIDEKIEKQKEEMGNDLYTYGEARMLLGVVKKEQAKGIASTSIDPDTILKCRSIFNSCKLVGSDKLRRMFTFPLQDIIK